MGPAQASSDIGMSEWAMDEPPVSTGAAAITIARRTVLQDLVRRYAVFIDDKPVGYLWAFQTGSYEVSPGPHRVRLAMANTGALVGMINMRLISNSGH